jgi:hypothetical protein
MKYSASIKLAAFTLPLFTSAAIAAGDANVSDSVIAEQRAALAANTEGTGIGPQSPRDIDSKVGTNSVVFSQAPSSENMNLCNIHLHKNAEHKGGEFTTYAGNGDGKGYQTGYKYSGSLTAAEKKPYGKGVCSSDHGPVQAGDTIEVHYVYSTAQVKPGATLGACVKSPILNPQLRVEGQVFVVVNDDKAADFNELTAFENRNNRPQAINIPADTGTPVQYTGSTTGPGYNEKGSPYQVTWSVRPEVKKVSIASLGKWCDGNVFEEDHAHGVRNLVTNPALLSPIQ